VARDATLIIIIRDKKGRNEGEQRKEPRGGKKIKNKKPKNQNVHVFKNCVSFSRCGLRIKRVLCSLA